MTNIIELLDEKKILPLYTAKNIEDSVKIGECLVDAGLPVVEVAFRSELAAQAIKEMAKIEGLTVGAGTVINLEQAKLAINNGAKFIVTPGINMEIVDYCLANNITIFPGVVTPTEIVSLINKGITNLKFFPAGNYGGLGTLKAFSGPFSQCKFIPTGGVSKDNFKEYLQASNVLAIGGSFILSNDFAKNKDYSGLINYIKELI